MTRNFSLGQTCPKSIRTAFFLGAIGLTTMSPALAQNVGPETSPTLIQFVQDGSSERIDNSGKLRMLSQRIVAASCFVQSGIDADASRATLQAASAEFTRITDALEFGDAELGIIGAEERRKTLVGINKLRELWGPIEAKAMIIADGQGTEAEVTLMADESARLLDIAVRLVVEISSQYASQTTVLQTDAFAIDVAGRQRMLAQRISKNACLISAGINTETAIAEMNQAAENFEMALNALRNGSEEVGIRPPPTQEIADGLSLVVNDWNNLKPVIALIASGSAVDAEQLAIVFHTSNALTGNMNRVVGLYSDASKIGT